MATNNPKPITDETVARLYEALLDLPEDSREMREQQDARERALCLREIHEAKQNDLARQVAGAFSQPMRAEVDPKLTEILYDALLN
jgi:hypothetical protein